MFTRTIAIATALVAATVQPVSAVATISAVGSKFFTSDGKQWFVKGIAYQLTQADPLIDTDQCELDATLMQELGANSIRVYHVDPTANHDGCMKAFSDAGIYLFLDLDTFNTAIPPDPPYWNQTQARDYAAVLDAFHQYDNLAGVFVGNEVLSLPSHSVAAPYVKAAARDLKAYRNSKGYRPIPVGYSAADIAQLRPMLQNYLVCGGNASEAVDFFSLNAYEWCGDVNYQTSGYVNLQQMTAGYPVPIFFSETGCNKPRARTFTDQAEIFGPNMVDTWSGAIVYEWIEVDNDYGLISYGPSVAPVVSGGAGSYVLSGTPTPIAPDFTNLKSQWATLSPTGVPLSAYENSLSNIKTPACPSFTPSGWLVNGNIALPTLGQTYNTAAPQQTVPSVTGSQIIPTIGTSATATATGTKGSANGGKEIAGMSMGLAGVMLGFIVWL